MAANKRTAWWSSKDQILLFVMYWAIKDVDGEWSEVLVISHVHSDTDRWIYMNTYLDFELELLFPLLQLLFSISDIQVWKMFVNESIVDVL